MTFVWKQLFFLFYFLSPVVAFTQQADTLTSVINPVDNDTLDPLVYKKNHQGIYLGYNWADYNISYTSFYHPIDSIWGQEVQVKKNFSVAYVYYFALTPKSFLRVGIGANFYSAVHLYNYIDTIYKTVFNAETGENIISLGMPLHLIRKMYISPVSTTTKPSKFSHNDTYFYLLGGGRLGRAIYGAEYYKPLDMTADIGAGISVKSKKMKFTIAPEIRYGYGFINLISNNTTDKNDNYRASFEDYMKSAKRQTFYFTVNIIL